MGEVFGVVASSSEELKVSSDTPKQQETSSSSTEAAKQGAMNDAVLTLIGSPEDFVLRRLIQDLDSIELVSKLLSKDAKPLRKQAVLAFSAEEMKRSDLKYATTEEGVGDENEPLVTSAAAATTITASSRPMSDECAKLRERQLKWTRQITIMLFQQTLMRQLKGGPKAWIKLSILSLRLVLGLVNRRILLYWRRGFGFSLSSSRRGLVGEDGQVLAPVSTA